jgi:hypothetical protein
MPDAGTISVGTTPVKLFDSETDGGRAAVYKINPTDGNILVGVVGMPGHPNAATAPAFPIPSGETEYLSLDQLVGGCAMGLIGQVWAKAESGTVSVNHGCVQARR